jgi:hypothetical protein
VCEPAKRIFERRRVKASLPGNMNERRPLSWHARHAARAFPIASALAFAVATVMQGGCSGGKGCDSAKCASGNACIDDGSGSGETCHRICTNQSECPDGYYCNDGQLGSQGKNWCAANTNYPPKKPGQWQAPCSASAGEGNNPACDSADFFACYGTSPTDTACQTAMSGCSFCTEFGCEEDSDCPGGWWCSTQNVGPNVTSAVETFGKSQTRTLCLPRWYCAPCKTDHDCALAADGSTQQHCVPDSNGNGFCAPQCQSDSNCTEDATCVPQWPICAPASGNSPAGAACQSDDDCPPTATAFQHCDAGRCTPECGGNASCPAGETCENLSVCVPRAGLCVGDGGFCSPCRSDADCTNGYCVSALPYSTERFCTVNATVADCDTSMMDPQGCPMPTSTDNWKAVGCTQLTPKLPDQCVAFVTLGTSSSMQYVPGCWTASR